ncbi:MAG: bifunctional 2-C-methyl-D-erythritol 4-phosphate cytidylyltransferase/2-C-methyl-D-erythritol 2,4-cyclodiphosphate synthase [Rhizobiales bacterium 65-9]|nr:bifunctional 2-C-methyl-D-erythritol 4-phosphate cytidylyltransferase/2-C-methyl-D-erythritol 2,4-cyclodiphosphate synthase [Hyphomicrobiales bacterium]OJY35669.1 MAG: bifunctional 2-C-methyl-D-erythritol 4-phosphate cytidylyltransferase/2-C-methyl-D-erythritol 2,4-cyclodiphosphate synthase [Rhizobiales bacterium 65-9]
MLIAALIVAAGRGVRNGSDIPKQYRMLAGRPVIMRAVEPFLVHPRIDHLLVAIHPDDEQRFSAIRAALPPGKTISTAFGGASRQESVRLGLEALAPFAPDIVLVHDAARPFVTPLLLSRAIEAAETHGAAVPGVPVTDTLVHIAKDGSVSDQPDRASARAIQTPQAFSFGALLAAHREAHARGLHDLTDDGAVMRAMGHAVHVFEGDRRNLKLTWPADFDEAERRLGGALISRVASGYDVHAFGPGDHVWIGGVRIDHDQGLVGHSDADAALHALTDALLGAASDGDIGMHFPPSDPQWRGASSGQFLDFAAGRIRALGGLIDHLDLTIVCEAPKIGPHRDSIRARISEIANVSASAVSIKATTSEKLGFTGRREGLAAYATATTRLPDSGAAWMERHD